MLSPDKHTDIKYSVLYISGLIMYEIARSGIIKYDDLKNAIIKKVGKEIGDLFEYSLSFLYLLGKINYNQQSDMVTI
ncbi:MAG: hypothetical protein LBP59_11160 [Planctomycetaceae bacterium]|jgi:hypothetical protein|nr:hypothetical protein [Planctomycetaceae bacterium]